MDAKAPGNSPAFPTTEGWKDLDIAELKSLPGMNLRTYIAVEVFRVLIVPSGMGFVRTDAAESAIKLADRLIDELAKN